jgi:hypothetical protein
MFTGMMWFDNDPKTALTEKVHRAAEYYRNKYGRIPDVCLVNPKMTPLTSPQMDAENRVNLGGGKEITLRASRSVLPGHLWIGVEEKNG